jgi:predicted porin
MEKPVSAIYSIELSGEFLMKKHIVAAAVAAAFAAPVMAQNITISGDMDVGYQESKISRGTTSLKVSGTGQDMATGSAASSRLRFDIVEDLGGGMKASVHSRLRTGIQGNNQATGDDFFAQLSGGFGTIKLGRYEGLAGDVASFTGAFSNANHAGTILSPFGDVVQGEMFTSMAATYTNDDVDAQNHEAQPGVLQYRSPVMNGLQVSVDIIKRSADDSLVAGKREIDQKAFQVSYKAGPLSVAATTSGREVTGTLNEGLSLNVSSGATGNTDVASTVKSKIQWVGASYDLGSARVYGNHLLGELKGTDGLTDSDLKVTTVGVQVPMGAITLFASAYKGTDSRTSSTAAGDDREFSGQQLAINYALSKRTQVYAVTGVNKDSAKVANSDNSKLSQTAVGLRHAF